MKFFHLAFFFINIINCSDKTVVHAKTSSSSKFDPYDFTNRRQLVCRLDIEFSVTQERVVKALINKKWTKDGIIKTVKETVEQSLREDWGYKDVDLKTDMPRSIICSYLRKLLTAEDYQAYCPDKS